MCFICVCVCVVAVTVFFAMWGKNYNTASVFGCVCRVRALEATAMFGRVRVCESMMVAEIQQCLAVSNCIYDSPWPRVRAVWVCVRNRD